MTSRALFESLLAKWRSDVSLVDVKQLTSDASPRRYYCLKLESEDPKAPQSIVVMIFDSVAGPEAGGDSSVTSDEAYVQLTKFFLQRSIPVPQLYCDLRKEDACTESVLLIEDLGTTLLADLVAEDAAQSSAEVTTLFKSALDLIAQLQAVPSAKDAIAFQREFTEALYLKEMQEFLDYQLASKQVSEDDRVLVENLCQVLAAELEGMEKVLVHRDFHGWNLMKDYTGNLRVIDFQDALLATPTYDVASLLNDRDMDTLLGEERCQELLAYFFSLFPDRKDLPKQYHRVLLQRDLKVAGRFAKLAVERGLTSYQQWVPGTLRRIGRTLKSLSAEAGADPAYGLGLGVLSGSFSDIKDGAG